MLNTSSWTTTLPIMVMGMVGIFIVITVIILAVMLLGKITAKKKDENGEETRES